MVRAVSNKDTPGADAKMYMCVYGMPLMDICMLMLG